MPADKDRPGGFYKIDNSILRDYGPKIGPYGIAIYNVLAMYANSDGGGIWPAYQTIADQIGASRPTVIKAMKTLCDVGLVIKQERMRKEGGTGSNLYVISRGKRALPRSKPDLPRPVNDVNPPSKPPLPNKDPIDQDPIDQEREPTREEPLKPPLGYKTITGVSSTYMPKGMSLPRGYVAAGTGTNAVQVYYERFRIDKPDERLNMPQCDDLARVCTDLDRLREVIIAYSRAGYKPRNINLILDWYRDGVPDKRNNRSARNGTYSRNGRRAEQPAPEPKPTVVVDAAFKEQLRRARGYAPKPIPIT